MALDLCNTLDPDVAGGDHLRADADVPAWLAHVGLGGTATLAEARAVRARIDAVLRPLATGGQPAAEDLDALRALEADGLSRARLVPGALEWDDPLAEIVHHAVELLVHGPVARLRVCGNCPWLFLDASRNGSRRWCSMEGCGTHVKARRLTERRRAARHGG